MADDGAAQQHEGQVQLIVAFVADAQAAEVVQPGEGALYDPALAADARAVGRPAPRDHWFHTALAQFAAVLFVVVAAIGEEPFGALAGPADLARARGRRRRSAAAVG